MVLVLIMCARPSNSELSKVVWQEFKTRSYSMQLNITTSCDPVVSRSFFKNLLDVEGASTCREKAGAPGTWRKIPSPKPEPPTPAENDEAGSGDDNDGFSEVKSRSTVKRSAKQSGQPPKNGSGHGGVKKESWGHKGDRVADRGDRAAMSTAPKKGGAW